MSYNSRAPGSFLQDRSVSIYGNSQMFDNANSELRFAKSYHQKLYHETPYDAMKHKMQERPLPQQCPDRIQQQEKNNFSNTEMKQLCTNQIHDNWLRKYNSPTFSRSNPILQNGNENVQQFKSSSKKTIFSDVSRIDIQHKEQPNNKRSELHQISTDYDWRPCLKLNQMTDSFIISNKASDEIKTRHSKEVAFTKCYNRNPIIDGDPKSIYQNKHFKEEAQASYEYRKQKEIRDVLPSNRVPVTSIDLPKYNIISHVQPQSTKNANEVQREALKIRKNASSESGVNSLISYQFAGKYRAERVTGKCNQQPKEERQLKFEQANAVDHRKKKMMTAQQNDNKKIVRNM